MPDFSPTFIKRDPITGLTFYDFDGHISAEGVDFSSELVSPTGVDPRKVSWKDVQLRERAYLFGYNELSEGAGAFLRTGVTNAADPNGEYANIEVGTEEGHLGSTQKSTIYVSARYGGASVRKLLIDQNGASDWMLNPVRLGQQSTWTSYGGGYPDPLLQVFGGMVTYTGLIKNTAAAAGQLLAFGNGAQAYHPTSRKIFTTMGSIGGANRLLRVDMVNDPTWGMSLIYQDVSANVDWLSLDGITAII